MVAFPDVLSCFLFDGLGYFCVLYSLFIKLAPFPAITRRFVIRDLVVDDILYLCGLLIALATLDVLCWIMSVMVSLVVSRLVLVVSRIGFSIQDGIRSSLILFVWHLLLVVSWSSIVSFPPLRPV